MNVNNRIIVTAPGDSDPQVPAVVGGSGVKAGSNVAGPLRSSFNDREGAGVASQAPATLTTTRADVGESRDAAAKIDRNKTPKPRSINISTLGEAELLSMIQQCVSGMNTFAANTRNVHKELKETITKTCMLLTQYARVKNQGPGDTSKQHTPAVPVLKNSVSVVTQTPWHEKARTAVEGIVKDVGTDTPCWWGETLLPQQQPTRGQRKERVARNTEKAAPAGDSQKQPSSAQARTDELNTHELAQDQEKTEWSEVARKRKPKPKVQSTTEVAANAPWNRAKKKSSEAARLVKNRTPKTEAIMIDKLTERETYASVMKRVTAIDLNSLGITVKGAKRSKAGGIIIEVDGKDDADRLAEVIGETVGATATVRRPIRSTPILILDVPNWIEETELASQLSNFDDNFRDCKIRLSDGRGGRTAFCRIPMKVASKIADVGRIRIGWAMCKVRLLERKDRVCYKCQGTGHIAANCNSEAKPKACYKCNSREHLARECVAPPKENNEPTRSRTPVIHHQEPERDPPTK